VTGSERRGDRRQPVRPVVATSGEGPDAVAIAPADEAVAVVLDLMNPGGVVRHGVSEGPDRAE